MRHARKQIVVTRPLSGEEIEYARLLGLDPEIRPALEFRFPRYWDRVLARINDLRKADWVFTSRNAVQALGELMQAGLGVRPQTDIYAVGDATAEALRELGIEARVPVRQDGQGLAEYILREGNSREILHFRGNLSRKEMSGILSDNGITVEEVEVYSTVITPVTLPAGNVEGVLFYSPSAVQGFGGGEGFEGDLPPLFAIGPTTADAIRKETGIDPAGVADKPDTRVLLRTVADHLFAETSND